MNDLHAVANRHHGRITVFVGGQLVTTCDSAEIIDKYPGGHRHYIVDPGFAQVFIAEKRRPGVCGEIVFPWQSTVDIFDDLHKDVQIFVNEQLQLTIPIQEHNRQYDVYRVLIAPFDKYLIIPDGQIVPAIYEKMFGPASYEACVKYVKEHQPPIAA
jgi:uncharacterized protein YbdZ (MbtH family)